MSLVCAFLAAGGFGVGDLLGGKFFKQESRFLHLLHACN